MRDVAERCGVSIKTVSRVVNGQPGASPELAARIHTAIKELGFRRNQLASDLRNERPTSMIGVIIEDVANPFYGPLIRSVEEFARRRGTMVLSASSDEDPVRESELVRELLSRRVAGLVLVSASPDHTYLAQELPPEVAVVFADRPAVGVQCDEVLFDNERGAREAVEHLLRRGHRRIGVIGDHDHIHTTHARIETWRTVLREHGLEAGPDLVRTGRHSAEDATRAAHELLDTDDPPTALFTTNNRSTIGAIRAIHSRDAQVGLVGFDDFELSELLDPPVTVVWNDPAALGMHAAEQLFRRLDGDARPPSRTVLRGRLVVRDQGRAGD